jgi:hypothetical protein
MESHKLALQLSKLCAWICGDNDKAIMPRTMPKSFTAGAKQRNFNISQHSDHYHSENALDESKQ